MRRPAPAGAALRERRQPERARRRRIGIGRRLRLAHGRRGGRPRRGGVSADTLGRRFCSAGLVSAVLASEALASSRVICAWLALSCAMVAFSSSTCWFMVARSRAIDCNWGDSAEGAVAAGSGGFGLNRCCRSVLPVARRPVLLRRLQWRARSAARRRPAWLPKAMQPARRAAPIRRPSPWPDRHNAARRRRPWRRTGRAAP